MSARQTVETFITALQSGDLELAARTMSNDFVISGLTTSPLKREEFLYVQSELVAAMSDFSYSLDNLHANGDHVWSTIAITGTHTNDLSLPRYGLPLVRATGIAVFLPLSNVEYRVVADKVTEMHIEALPGGGLNGLIQQIGAELPLLPKQDLPDLPAGE